VHFFAASATSFKLEFSGTGAGRQSSSLFLRIFNYESQLAQYSSLVCSRAQLRSAEILSVFY